MCVCVRVELQASFCAAGSPLNMVNPTVANHLEKRKREFIGMLPRYTLIKLDSDVESVSRSTSEFPASFALMVNSASKEPYQTLDGFLDRVCRGSNIYDSQASYYAIYSPSVAPTLDACKDLCRRTHSCKGIEYRGWCEVWTRPGGIDAVAPSLGAQCWQYRPFVHVEGGVNRACRGEDELDNWPSYYSVHGLTGIEACKSLCVRTDGCKGIDYRPGRCEVWTRRGGIQKTAYFEGSLCMRLGPNDVWDDNNAFVALNGGSGTCQGTGMSALTRGSLSLHSCKVRCMSTPACRGIGYSSAVCTLWLGSGELSVIPDPDSSCHSYQPFRDIDGGENRDCRGSSSGDLLSTYYVQMEASSIQACQDACVQHAETDVLGKPCKGIAFDAAASSCRLWLRAQGIEATVEKTGSSAVVQSLCFHLVKTIFIFPCWF